MTSTVDAGWPLPPRGGGYFHIRISYRTLIALVVSLLLHALLLLLLPKPVLESPPARAKQQSMVVRLNTVEQSQPEAPQVEEPVAAAPPEPSPEPPKPEAKKPQPKPKPRPKPEPRPERDMIVLDKREAKHPPPAETASPPPEPEPAAKEAPAPPVQSQEQAPADMMAYVNAARARRNMTELEAARRNAEAAARERGPTAEELKEAIIKRNLTQGTNGVFQILAMDDRHARFSFRGWTDDYSNAKRQIIDVETVPGEDIQRAVVRRMISLIRQYYKGDFNWESHRLDRVVTLSARLEDNAGLEDFLIEEFFGTQGIAFAP